MYSLGYLENVPFLLSCGLTVYFVAFGKLGKWKCLVFGPNSSRQQLQTDNIWISVLPQNPASGKHINNSFCQTQRQCCCLFPIPHPAFQHFPSHSSPCLTLCCWGQGFKKEQVEGKEVLLSAASRWSGPDGFLPPPDALYLSISTTGTQWDCNRYGLIAATLCLEVGGGGWVGVGPALGLYPGWQIQYSSPQPTPLSCPTQMLQLCTAPTDENLILGWEEVGGKFVAHSLSVRSKYRQEIILSFQRLGLGTLFVFAKQQGSQGLCRTWFYRLAPFSSYLRLLYLTSPPHLTLCNGPCTYSMLGVCLFPHLFVNLMSVRLSTPLWFRPLYYGFLFSVPETHPLGAIKKMVIA